MSNQPTTTTQPTASFDDASYTHQIQEAVTFLKTQGVSTVDYGIVLGSGMGAFAEQFSAHWVLPYSDIPHYRGTSIEGHKGFLYGATYKDTTLVIMQGRLHGYEGHTPQQVTFLHRVLSHFSPKGVILTNAAGLINQAYQPGDFMLISDHINFTGQNPLVGTNMDEYGPRFPDMSGAYDPKLRERIVNSLTAFSGQPGYDSATQQLGFDPSSIREGVYIGVLGPSFETPAEIQAFKVLGADAVGMSTVWESIVLQHIGIPVVGVSLLSNYAAGLQTNSLTHQEVMDQSNHSSEAFQKFLQYVLDQMIQRSL